MRRWWEVALGARSIPVARSSTARSPASRERSNCSRLAEPSALMVSASSSASSWRSSLAAGSCSLGCGIASSYNICAYIQMFPLLLPMGAARRRFRDTAALDMPAHAEPRTAHDPPGSIFIRFLKFGALAWGGPAAQISMISRECVEEERWVDEETFKKTLAVYQVLPGPEAHELCVYFGRMRGGRLGAL